MRSIEQKIRAVDATMAMEGMPLMDEDKNRLRSVFEGKSTADKIVQSLVRKHSQKRRSAYGRV